MNSQGTPQTTQSGPVFYKSFKSYEIPFRPDEPLDYEDTENLNSFYAAWFDRHERLVRFDKLRIVRVERVRDKLTGVATPGSRIYFKIGSSGPPHTGRQVSYQETQSLNEYYRLDVGDDGSLYEADHLKREIAFSDEYEYWPNRQIRLRKQTRTDGTQVVTIYTPDGIPVNDFYSEAQFALTFPCELSHESATYSATYGKFTLWPCERALGETIGNSLRHVLLSSLEGTAVTNVKIQGVLPGGNTIPGVVESLTDVIKNIKSLAIKIVSDQSKIVKINKNEKGVIKGADIITDETVEIINPDNVIATLKTDEPFVVEMTVESGRGYRTTVENSWGNRELDSIPVDSSFSPVVRVKYEVEVIRVSQKKKFDKLTLEIWTNGTLTPLMALREAVQILKQPINTIIHALSPYEIQANEALESKLDMRLAELELSVRATNMLESEGIVTVGDLIQRTEDELLEVRKFSETTLREVKEKLTEKGLALGTRLVQRQEH